MGEKQIQLSDRMYLDAFFFQPGELIYSRRKGKEGVILEGWILDNAHSESFEALYLIEAPDSSHFTEYEERLVVTAEG